MPIFTSGMGVLHLRKRFQRIIWSRCFASEGLYTDGVFGYNCSFFLFIHRLVFYGNCDTARVIFFFKHWMQCDTCRLTWNFWGLKTSDPISVDSICEETWLQVQGSVNQSYCGCIAGSVRARHWWSQIKGWRWEWEIEMIGSEAKVGVAMRHYNTMPSLKGMAHNCSLRQVGVHRAGRWQGVLLLWYHLIRADDIHDMTFTSHFRIRQVLDCASYPAMELCHTHPCTSTVQFDEFLRTIQAHIYGMVVVKSVFKGPFVKAPATWLFRH